MNGFILWIVTNPLFFIGAILAFIACIGFLIFLRGFLLGLTHLFYIDGHDMHTQEARVRSTWGAIMMINMFVVWVVVRAIATVVGHDTADLGKTTKILVVYAILVAFLYLKGFAFHHD